MQYHFMAFTHHVIFTYLLYNKSDILPLLYGLYISLVTLWKDPVNMDMFILLSKIKKIQILILISWENKIRFQEKKEIRKIQEMLVKENDECQGCLRFQRHQLFPSKS